MTKAYTKLREDICFFAKSMFDRGLTSGNSGNISVRTEDGGLLVTPTGSSFGRLDPAQLSLFNENLEHISGDKPTKEMPLHQAFYETRTQTGAVVHLHSTHSVALSLLNVEDEESFLPPLTPYAIMKLGKVTLLPFMLPGSAQIGQAIRGLAGKRSAVMLAHHGPVVAGKDLEAACFAMEELEETAHLALLLHGKQVSQLSQEQVQLVVRQFNVEW
ncbi:MAG: aldolase [Alphaproteobacteria bacterium]|nr:aldolase [Alphaproteobacteria bacterium]